MSASVTVVVCVMLCTTVFNPWTSSASPMAMYFKKSNVECVNESGKCFNTEECCSGFTCAVIDDHDDSVESPGRCIRGKNLMPCSSDADCEGFNEACTSLMDAEGQRYCLPTSADSDSGNDDVEEVRQELSQLSAPSQHQAYSRVLTDFGGKCMTSADCRPYAAVSGAGKVRVCCQQVRRGRQGDRRICDRITPLSVCISSPTM